MDELRSLIGKQFIQTPAGIFELDAPGCALEEESLLQNVTVQILRCKKCGRRSIAWWRQDNTVEIPGGIAELERTGADAEEDTQ